MATHSSLLARRIPWTEEPGKLQSMGWQRVRHVWATNTFTFICLFKITVYVLCNVVSVSAVQWRQSAICIHISHLSWASLPPQPHPTHLGHHRALSWAPSTVQWFPLAGNAWWCVRASLSVPIHPSLPSPTVSTCPFLTAASLSSLQIGSFF